MKSLKSAEKGTSKGNKKGHELLEIYVHTVKIIQLLKITYYWKGVLAPMNIVSVELILILIWYCRALLLQYCTLLTLGSGPSKR